jgi:4Fe-4S iron-sulfur cluster binding domain/DR2241 stabilising domain
MIENPAMKEFAAQIQEKFVLAQVLIQRDGKEYELRHVEDDEQKSLKLVPLSEIRLLAQCTATGEFRPLKSAPTLSRGWQIRVANEVELEFALNQLYPGAIADWYAARQVNPPVTHYREYVNRQSGMYRITAMLSDAQVAEVIGGCCNRKLCLKRRCWSISTVPPDAPSIKSVIPCLEPCALLMETARKTMRAEQQAKLAIENGPK